jgi:hypothetical protein
MMYVGIVVPIQSRVDSCPGFYPNRAPGAPVTIASTGVRDCS